MPSVRGRPHYYSSKKEEYAIIKFSLDADLSSLFTWNTKQLFVYVTAEWPSAGGSGSGQNASNQAVIWDSIITAPSADHLANLGPIAMKKLKRSAQGKSIDPSRYAHLFLLLPLLCMFNGCVGLTLWMNEHSGKLSIKNQRPKYQITHPTGKVAEQEDVVLRLHYNVQPWVGFLTWNQDADIWKWKTLRNNLSKKFTLPAIKKKSETK
jgi:hypothetical protein